MRRSLFYLFMNPSDFVEYYPNLLTFILLHDIMRFNRGVNYPNIIHDFLSLVAFFICIFHVLMRISERRRLYEKIYRPRSRI